MAHVFCVLCCLLSLKMTNSDYNNHWLGWTPDILYSRSLWVTLIVSQIVPVVPAGDARGFFTCMIGLLNVVFFAGSQVFHMFFLIYGSYSIMLIFQNSRQLKWIMIASSFGYCTIVRLFDIVSVYHLFSAVNTMFLIAVLKIVEYSDDVLQAKQHSKLNSSDTTKTNSSEKDRKHQPLSFKNYSFYMFFFPGLWSGPFLPYRHFITAINSSNTIKIRSFRYIISRTIETSPAIVAYIFLRGIVSPRFFESWAFKEQSFVYKLLSVASYSYLRRARYVVAWMVAEYICVCAGVGYFDTAEKNAANKSSSKLANTKTTTTHVARYRAFVTNIWQYLKDTKIDETVVRNYDLKLQFLSTNARDTIRSWNCSVQAWFVRHIYLSLKPFQMRGNVRRLLVMLISSLWHGVSIGFYLMFSNLWLLQVCEAPLWSRIEVFKLRSNVYISTLCTFVQFCINEIFLMWLIFPFFVESKITLMVWQGTYFVGLLSPFTLLLANSIIGTIETTGENGEKHMD